MKAAFSVLLGALWVLPSAPAMPHHSFAAEFDLNRPIELTGTVTRIDWTNPHAWLHINVADDGDNVQSWAIELLGVNTLFRRGWTRDKVKPGDIVNVEGFGARNGANSGNASVVTLANTGERLWDSANQ